MKLLFVVLGNVRGGEEGERRTKLAVGACYVADQQRGRK